MKKALLAAVAVAALTATAFAQTSQPGTSGAGSQASPSAPMQNVSTQQFVQMAAMSDLYEVESSKLAAEKAQSQETKRFAKEMIEDHQKTTQELKSHVQKTNLSGVSMPTQLDQKHQQMLNELKQASGQQFDALYEDQQHQAHMQAINLFRSYGQTGDNPELRQWAQKTLPELQKHFQKTEALMKDNKTTGRR